MKHRIILTGSNGLLGQKIINILAGRANVQLLATSRGVNRHAERGGYLYKDLDLLDYGLWAAEFASFKPTAVIHTAAMTQVDACEEQRESCDKINAESVHHLAQLCKEYDTHLVHISTDFVFDGAAGPYAENAKPNPVNYYGQAKLKAEQHVQENAGSWSILRTMLLYGITPSMSRSNIVLWVKRSLEAEKEIKVVDDQFRCPTLAEDLANAAVSAAMRKAQGIFHISGAEMMSIYEIAERAANFWKLDTGLMSHTDSASLNQAAKRPPKTGFLILKAQTELDYQPHSFAQGLAIVDQQIREMN
ncbi:MAG: SDR family oxidoreductase [Bacteroidota bacterium]